CDHGSFGAFPSYEAKHRLEIHFVEKKLGFLRGVGRIELGKDSFEELPLEENLRIKTSIQDPPTDLESKPLPKHLEYDFLEKDSLLPLGISALLKDDEKKHLVSVLKN
ncbi:hypothetical protein Tco_0245123, partial [Tanacetum coccineum]